jgi:hypothetical protein
VVMGGAAAVLGRATQLIYPSCFHTFCMSLRTYMQTTINQNTHTDFPHPFSLFTHVLFGAFLRC